MNGCDVIIGEESFVVGDKVVKYTFWRDGSYSAYEVENGIWRGLADGMYEGRVEERRVWCIWHMRENCWDEK